MSHATEKYAAIVRDWDEMLAQLSAETGVPRNDCLLILIANAASWLSINQSDTNDLYRESLIRTVHQLRAMQTGDEWKPE